jgi:hypothetical protein
MLSELFRTDKHKTGAHLNSLKGRLFMVVRAARERDKLPWGTVGKHLCRGSRFRWRSLVKANVEQWMH